MRSTPLLLSLVFLTLGCGGGGGATTPDPTPFPDPNPLFVTPVADSARAGSALIGPGGGTVTATSASGVTITLSIPATSMLLTTTITLMPLARIDGGIPGALVAGASITPAVVFPRGATVSFETTNTDVVALRLDQGAGGIEAALTAMEQLCIIDSVDAITIPIAGSATVALVDNPLATMTALEDRVPSVASLRIEHAFGLATQDDQRAHPCDALGDRTDLLNRIYRELVAPALTAATLDDARFGAGYGAFGSWLRLVRLTAGESDTRIATDVAAGKSSLALGADVFISAVPFRCDDHDFAAAFGAIEILAMLDSRLLTPDTNTPHLNRETIEALAEECLRFRSRGRFTSSFDITDAGNPVANGGLAVIFETPIIQVRLPEAFELTGAASMNFSFELLQAGSEEKPCGEQAGPATIQFDIAQFDLLTLLNPGGPALTVQAAVDGPVICSGAIGEEDPEQWQQVNVAVAVASALFGPSASNATALDAWVATNDGSSQIATLSELQEVDEVGESGRMVGEQLWEAELLHVTD